MRYDLSRRNVLIGGLALAAAPLAASTGIGPQTPAQGDSRPPRLPDDLVREFVIAAHSDLAKTQKMLGEQPRLLNATWDWSNGDFEMAIGGAGHMGRRDIAEFLISQGARYDLFVAAMMDQIEVVKPILIAHPALAASKGPHGIPLAAHAEHRKAEKVLDFLKSFKA